MNSYNFTFCYCNNSVQLKIWSRYIVLHVLDYPLTYTIQECLEDWCDHLGYGFINYVNTNEINTKITGTFGFVVRKDK